MERPARREPPAGDAVVLPLPGQDALAEAVARDLRAEPGRLAHRRFPDGESLVRLDTPVAGRHVVLAGSLARPDVQLGPLLLSAATARQLGAERVGLLAPYLPYLRQDAAFEPGQGVSARWFGALLSASFDGIVTVEPHLHRLACLDEVFDVPAVRVGACGALAEWIGQHVSEPFIGGPDAESDQWARRVASHLGTGHAVLAKRRRGDRDVEVSDPCGALAVPKGATPVLVDDIVSTGETLAAAARHLAGQGHRELTAVAVHAVLVDGAEPTLRDAGIACLATSDTIPHPTNALSVTPLLAGGVLRLVEAWSALPAISGGRGGN